MPAVNESIHAPEFVAGKWLNSPPLTMRGLRGCIVLIDFWDYTCINCLRTLPYQREWWRRYKDHGFALVGIHAPEFTFAHEDEQVRQAVARLGITYPVLLDDNHQNWAAWANRFWPAKYLVDERGYIRYFHYGEGDYHDIETWIQQALRRLHPGVIFPAPMAPIHPTDQPGAACYRATPELYVGYQRGCLGNHEALQLGKVIAFADPGEVRMDVIYVDGYWRPEMEALVLAADEGTLRLRYRAQEVNVVLAPPADGEAVVVVEQDGAPLAYEALGEDVRPTGQGMAVCVDAPRMYNLVRNPLYGMHDLCLQVKTAGTAVYAFSFVTGRITGERPGEEAA